jgi:Xaa-Pro aminopeptidase
MSESEEKSAALVAELERRRSLLSEAMERDGTDLMLTTQSSAWTEYVSGISRLEARRAELPQETYTFCAMRRGDYPCLALVHSNWKLEIEQRGMVSKLGYEVFALDRDPVGKLRDAARGPVASIWVDTEMLFPQIELVQRAFPKARLSLFPESAWRIRLAKSRYEVDRLRAAGELTESAFRELARRLPGRFTRWDFLEEARHEFTRRNTTVLAVPIVAYALTQHGPFEWGRPLALAPHDVIEPPALLTIDGGARVEGYSADLGRTLALGEVPAEWERSYAVARAAQEAALKAVRSGSPASDVDRAARKLVEAEGFSKAFWIASGHGIGLDVHEYPRLAHYDATTLQPGMALAVEVGLWNRGAVGFEGPAAGFAEDTVVLVEDGLERLTQSPPTPIMIG